MIGGSLLGFFKQLRKGWRILEGEGRSMIVCSAGELYTPCFYIALRERGKAL